MPGLELLLYVLHYATTQALLVAEPIGKAQEMQHRNKNNRLHNWHMNMIPLVKKLFVFLHLSMHQEMCRGMIIQMLVIVISGYQNSSFFYMVGKQKKLLLSRKISKEKPFVTTVTQFMPGIIKAFIPFDLAISILGTDLRK